MSRIATADARARLRALAIHATDLVISETRPRRWGSVWGKELRAWRVTDRRGRVFRVAEYDGPDVGLHSERGLRLRCHCTTALIHRVCMHAIAVARHLDGGGTQLEEHARRQVDAAG